MNIDCVKELRGEKNPGAGRGCAKGANPKIIRQRRDCGWPVLRENGGPMVHGVAATSTKMRWKQSGAQKEGNGM